MFPNILSDEPSVTANSIRFIANRNIDKELELKNLILSAKHIDRYPFSSLSGEAFMCYLITCLTWTKIDVGLVNAPQFKSRLNHNLKSVLELLSLKDQSIVILSSLEEELCAIIK